MTLPDLPTAEGELGAKTDHVDDVTAADHNNLARLIEALALTVPRRFGDDTDHFEIDPANSRISAAGTARATRSVQMNTSLVTGLSAAQVGFAGGPAREFADGSTKALYFSCVVPSWADVAEEMTIVVPYGCTADYSNKVVRLSYAVSSKVGGVVAVSENIVSTITADCNTPLSAPANAVTFLQLCTIPPDSLVGGESLQLYFSRLGADANDTLDQDLYLINPAFLVVKQKELA